MYRAVPDYPVEEERAFPTESTVRFRATDSNVFVAERGSPPRADSDKEPGSNLNPIANPALFTPPLLPPFEFLAGVAEETDSEIRITGEAHVARNGKILYFRLYGDRRYQVIIETFADHLQVSRLLPARRGSRAVSVLFNFEILISKSPY